MSGSVPSLKIQWSRICEVYRRANSYVAFLRAILFVPQVVCASFTDHNFELCHLPVYLPQLNPKGLVFAQLKQRLRTAQPRTFANKLKSFSKNYHTNPFYPCIEKCVAGWKKHVLVMTFDCGSNNHPAVELVTRFTRTKIVCRYGRLWVFAFLQVLSWHSSL